MTHPVLDQLSLWIEGDLPDQDAKAVQAHLDHCPSCQAEAERLRTSQAWLREALASPFDAADRAQFRQSVMGQLRAEPARKPILRFAVRGGLLAASAAALLVATLTWRHGRPLVLPQPAPDIPAVTPPSPTPAQPETVQRPVHRSPARAAPMPAMETLSAAREGPSRIEFQTADPTIRIIWLARATPLPDATLPHQEKP